MSAERGAGPMPLVVTGARQHNLRDVSVVIPRGALTVVTGPSGSGKSSLAFDTIYAEGQRRYVESLSAYARQFLDQMPKPDVDSIEGLSPAIAIQQKTVSKNPRSTVGTVTEIHDHLRLLYARAGLAHCPTCGRHVRAMTAAQMVDAVLAWPEGTRAVIVAPLPPMRAEERESELAGLRRDGFARVELDGRVTDLSEVEGPVKAESIALQVDRLTVRPDSRARIAESLELAATRSGGVVVVRARDGELEPLFLSTGLACAEHGPVLASLEPQTFSFNSPDGACPRCNGLGEVREFEPGLIVPDPALSIAEGALAPWGKAGAPYHRAMSKKLTAALSVNPKTAWKRLRTAQREQVLGGHGEWPGVIELLETRARDIRVRKREAGEGDEAAEYLEEELGKFSARAICPDCQGARLRAEARAVTVGERSLPQVGAMPVSEARAFFDALRLEGARAEIAARLLTQIRARLGFLDDVGLGYLGLSRASATLSGGEAARIRLATQIGAALVGVLYVLDEPSIGLHARDTERLLVTIRRLRDAGNTVLVVEHDEQTIRAADRIIDMGPGAGRLGGAIVAEGTLEEILADEASVTGAYLSGRARTPTKKKRRRGRRTLRVLDARTHNLRGVDIAIPLGALTVVTGVSGSGKSSLIVDTLLPVAREQLNGAAPATGIEARVEGLGQLDKVIAIDQAPIGRTPRSNPATYSGVFTLIRELYGALPEARARGFSPGRFSFNVKGGRCEACKGDGVQRVEMHFLPDVFVTCEQCAGRRYDRETLEVRYRGLSVADLLETTVDEALELLGAIPKIRERLAALSGVGLGYVKLGQSATTLSGGEAQRLKLAKELAKRSTGSTLFVLDEPTTGLHFGDVEVLLDALESLVDAGNTVVVIEHDLEVVRRADWVIDLGPEGGSGGGAVVVQGTPEEVAACQASVTGGFLAGAL